MYKIEGVSKRGNYCIVDEISKSFITKSELRLLLLNNIKVDGVILDEKFHLLTNRSVKSNILEETEDELYEIESEQVEEVDQNSVLAHIDELNMALDNGIYCSKRDIEELNDLLKELGEVDKTEDVKNLISKIEDTLANIDDGHTIEETISKNNFKPIPYELFANAKRDEQGSWVWSDEEESQDDSTLTKLQSLLNEEQNNLIRDYIFYLSRRAFELNKGTVSINELTKKKIDKLKDIKKGGTWVYAGMVDYGYMGSSICPHCRARMSEKAVSKCCNDIVFTNSHKVRVLKDLVDPSTNEVIVKEGAIRAKKSLKELLDKHNITNFDEDVEFTKLYNRTYNGKCNNCGSTCACITRDAITSTKKNREKQHGIICSNCGKELVQQTHYTTFGDQVRYVHILWNIEDSDLETDFYGQLVNNSLEKVLESKKCIKFGLDNAANMLGIAKGSMAYQALQLAQKASIEDIAEMYAQLSSTSYKVNNNEIPYYTTTTPEELKTSVGQNGIVGLQATIDFVNKLKMGNLKNNLANTSEKAKKEGTDFTAIIEPKAITMFDSFLKNDMIPPRTLVLLIRDQFCGWKSHYFGNRTKNPETKEVGKREFRWLGEGSVYSDYMLNSIQTYFGDLKDLNDLLNKPLVTRVGYYLTSTLEGQGYTQNDLNHLYLYQNDVSLFGLIRKYAEIYLEYLVCGIYAYSGSSPNITEVYKNLSKFKDAYKRALEHIRRLFFTDVDYKPDYLIKLNGLLKYIREARESLKEYRIPIKHEDEDGFYIDAKDSDFELLSDYYKEQRTFRQMDKIGRLLFEYENSIGSTTFVEAFSTVVSMFYTGQNKFKQPKNQSIDEYKAKLETIINYVNDNADRFNEFCINKWQKQIDELNDAKRIAIAEEDVKRKELELAELEKNEIQKEVDGVVTAIDLVNYLKDKDFSKLPDYLSDGKAKTFHLDILDTVKNTTKVSSAQLYRLKTLFKDYTGIEKDFVLDDTPTRAAAKGIEEIENLVDLIDYFTDNPQLMRKEPDVTRNIFNSVKLYKRISERQARFFTKLVDIYKENTGNYVDLSELLN